MKVGEVGKVQAPKVVGRVETAAMALTVQKCHSVVEVRLAQVQVAAKVSLHVVKVKREKDVVSETGVVVGVTGVVEVVGATEVEVVEVTEVVVVGEYAKVVGRMVGAVVVVVP